MTSIQAFKVINEAISVIQNLKSKPVLVAINGIEGSGKTVFAQHLVQYLSSSQLNAIHVSVDGFHNKREIRYSKGRDSAIGYYEDSYDEKAFAEKVLIASQSTNPHYTAAIHNLETDEYLTFKPISISPNTIVVTDGSYLFKKVYRNYWDLKIYLKTDFETARHRGALRDAGHLGGIEAAKKKFISRYHSASLMYIQENNPESLADIILDNTDFNDIKLLKIAKEFHNNYQ